MSLTNAAGDTSAGGPKAAPSNSAGGPKAAPSNSAGGPKAAPSNKTRGEAILLTNFARLGSSETTVGARMKKPRVGVIMGGTSGEREVSLRSGAAVAGALAARGHDV